LAKQVLFIGRAPGMNVSSRRRFLHQSEGHTMFAIRSAWQRCRAALGLAALAGALAPPGALAQESVGELRAVPSALLSIDQHRPVVIERIVEVFRPAFGPGQEATVREALAGMRADRLLAASLAPNLDGLLAVMKSAESPSTIVLAKPVGKALGDVGADVVYTPVTPCRIVDTRSGAGGPLAAGDTRNWLAANPGGTFVSQGGSASNCGIPVKPAAVLVNLTVANTQSGPAFLVGYPFNQARPNAASLNWVAVGTQIANAIILPLCTGGGCTSDWSLFASSGTELIVDVMGYFAAPVATAVDCVSVASAGTAIAVSSDTLVPLPACAGGYTRTGSQCTGAANIPSGYLVETSAAGCLYRNLSSVATFNATATATCCRVPGR
jgi:hypothetical protein